MALELKETLIGVLTVGILSYVVKIYLVFVAFGEWLGKFLNEGIIFSDIFTWDVVFSIYSRIGCFLFFSSLIFLIKVLIFSGGSI